MRRLLLAGSAAGRRRRPLNRLLLSPDLRSTHALRQAAAQLRGDIMLLHTLDTKFHTQSQLSAPLKRTGFVYGVAAGTATDTRRSSAWNTEEAIDRARLRTERDAFSAALKEVARTWSAINTEYSRTTVALRTASP